MKKLFFILFITTLVSTIVSCTGNEEDTIDQFFDAYNKEDYSVIELLLSQEKMSGEMIEFVKYMREDLGEIKSHTKYSSHKDFENDGSLTFLYYECQASNNDEKVYVKFNVVGSDKTLKIVSILYSTNKDFIDDYEHNKKAAIEYMDEYYEAIENEDRDALYKMLDENIKNDDEIVKKFFEILDSRIEYYGTIKEHNFEFISSELIDDTTYFHVYYRCETDRNEFYTESVSLILVDDEFEIFDYRYAPKTEDLMKDF